MVTLTELTGSAVATRSSYFQLRRLRTIRKAVSVPIFTSIVYTFVCSKIDYCNSLLIDLPKTGYLPFRLYSTWLCNSLPDFPVTPIYLLTLRDISIGFQSLYSHLIQSAPYCPNEGATRDATRVPTSASSLRPPRSLDRWELFCP